MLLEVPGRSARAVAIAELAGVRYLVGKQMYDALTCGDCLQRYCALMGQGMLLAWCFVDLLCNQI